MSAKAIAAAPETYGRAPVLLFVDASQRRLIPLRRVPFSIGRKVDNDLVLNETRCSRDHARIVLEDNAYFLIDCGSKLGTYVNGVKVQRHELKVSDVIEFGVRGGACLVFDPPDSAEQQQQLAKPSGWMLASGSGDFASLSLLLEAARKLNSSTVLDDVLVTVLETSLRLTKAERAFVFLRDSAGGFLMAAGRNSRGDILADDQSISRSSLMEAAESGCEFVVNEADDLGRLVGRVSVENFGISSVICIPLRRVPKGLDEAGSNVTIGMLYLDSQTLSGRLSAVSHDVLRTIATEAAALVENATLVKAQQEARRAEQELEIAAEIHRRLISPTVPEVPFAEVRGRSIPCDQTGGDFFEVIATGDSISVVVADVAGKGISAALLASVLQGMAFTQLRRGEPLQDVAAAAHDFLCERRMSKYATMVLARLHADGELEILNCGHVPPVLVSGKTVRYVEGGCVPIGLIPIAEFTICRERLDLGEQLLIVSDGVTDARNMAGQFYGSRRLHLAAREGLDSVFASLAAFRGNMPPEDDCTAVEIIRK